MKSHSRFLLTSLLALALLTTTAGSTLAGSGMGTAFTYRGQLLQSGSPYTGQCDFWFGLWDASTVGSQISSTQNSVNVTVTAGVFDVSLDFGAGAFDGSARWLETAVRCPSGSGSYTTLSPRQNLTPMPYSLYASVAGSVANGGVTNSMLSSGSITNDKLASSAITVTAGTGLAGGGPVNLGSAAALNVAATYRLPQACAAGQVPVADGAGGWTCGSNGVPSGTIAYYPAAACPSGWTEVTAARGRVVVALPGSGTISGTVGTALGNLLPRTVALSIANLPPHTHDVDPAVITATTSTSGSHTHAVTSGQNTGGGVYFGTYQTLLGNTGATTGAGGAHSHTVAVDIPNTTSTATGDGVPTDVTMPYIELLMCQKN